ncbi:LlaJI family restriction endonuclease [Streptococcus suis]
MENELKTHYLMDGDEIDESIASKIPNYVKSFGTKRYCNFVGIILQDQDVLFSFPKHYDYNSLSDEKRIEVMNGMLHLFYRGGIGSGSGKQNQFPFDAYQTVLLYMKKFGLYQRQTKIEKFGYSGRINWNKTLRKSNSIIQKNGIVFMPFVTTHNINYSEFLSECMEFVLSYSFETYSQFVDIFYKYSNFPNNPIFKDFSRCILELQRIQGNYFKDEEKKLINALIQFFRWRTSTLSNLILATTKFDTYWESMIEVYLNGKFSDINPETEAISWNGNSGKKFIKPEKEFIEDELLRASKNPTGNREIQFDHFSIDQTKKEIVLLDSKYIYQKGFREFNYKQAFYYYYLKSLYGDDYKIYNGLLSPTAGNYEIKVHVDRNTVITGEHENSKMGFEKVDGLKIVEHYINMAEVIQYSKENISTFLSILANNESIN